MAQAPEVGPLPPLRSPSPLAIKLPNGLEVIAIPRKVAPIISMNLLIRSGADCDPPDMAGVASATADMLDEGAGDRSALQIAEDLEQLGADLWLGAGRDGSQLTLQVPATTFEPALAIAADVVLRPRFAEDDWRRVQNDRLTGLAQRRDQPEAVANIVADRTLFGDGHPYGFPVEGLERTARAITREQVRRFHDVIWRPNNAVLVISGDFDPAEVERQLQRAFATWTAGPIPPLREAPPFPKLPRLVLVDRPAAPQTIVRVLAPGVARSSPDRAALSLLNAIFGGTFTSRLNFNLREQKGYTYGAGSSFAFYRRPGLFSARAAVFTEVTDAAVTEFLNELRGLREKPITADEISKGRATLLGRVAEGLSTAGGVAGYYAEVGLYQLPLDEPARFLAAIGAAGSPELQALAARYLDPDRVTIVVVGDRAAIEPGLRARGLPEPVVRDTDGEPIS
jgi:predicted Zn-dependent peptidase